MKPKVTIIIPSYNHAKFIAEAIQSALDQTYQDFEILICDDASKDDSVSIIKQFENKRISLVVNEKNLGACVTVNSLIQKSKGDYIALLNSDDIWLPNKLEIQVAFLETHKNYNVLFSDAIIIKENGEDFNDQEHFYTNMFAQPNRTREEWLRSFYFNGNCLCHPSMLIRKTVYDEIGLYNPLMASLPDFEMWVRICLKYNIHVLPDKLVKFRILDDEQNASANNIANIVRGNFELSKVYDQFYNIDDAVFFSEIFPEYKIDNVELIPLKMAEICLGDKRNSIKLAALNKIYNLLSNNKNLIKIFSATQFNCIASEVDAFNISHLDNKIMQLFYDNGNDFNDNDCLVHRLIPTRRKYTFNIEGISGLLKIRIDPVNAPAQIKLQQVNIIKSDLTEIKLDLISHNADEFSGNVYTFYHDDPILIFNVPELCRTERLLCCECFFEIRILNDHELSTFVRKLMYDFDLLTQQRENEVHLMNQKLQSKDQELQSKDKKLQSMIQEQQIQEQNLECIQNRINRLLNSRSWKLTKPIRAIKHLFFN